MCEFVFYIYMCDLSAVIYVEKQRKGRRGKKIPSFEAGHPAAHAPALPTAASGSRQRVFFFKKNIFGFKKIKNIFADCQSSSRQRVF